MWDLPGPGLEPVSPALAGGFLTTAPPGKSRQGFLLCKMNTYYVPSVVQASEKKKQPNMVPAFKTFPSRVIL